jgi:CRP-like cAMP-binding protein
MTVTSLLAGTELFEGLDDEVIAQLSELATQHKLRRNDVIFAEGDESDALFVVSTGRVAIANKSVDGRESVVVSIPYAPIRALYEKQPEQLWRVVRLLAGRIRNMDEALADAVFLDVTGRTAKRLLELAGEKDEFVLPITQEELAGMVGASRERVNKAIAAFIRLGWIQQIDRRYVITNRRQLEIRAR